MNSREKYILQALQQTGSISLSELSSTLGVSLVTIRKDVANLEAKELVSRQHGSVSLPYQYENNQIPFSLREAFNEQDKKLIAKAAATLIHPLHIEIREANAKHQAHPKRSHHISVEFFSRHLTYLLIKNERRQFFAPFIVCEKSVKTLCHILVVTNFF